MARSRTTSRPRKTAARRGRKRTELRNLKAVAVGRRKALSVRMARAHFDAAMTTDENYRHWAAADDLSPDALASDWVRRTLRRRSRYEVRNNCYAKGMILTLANDVIGTGPRLQMLSTDDAANERIERAFTAWSRRVRMAQKLRTMRMARAQDGEAFIVFFTNRRLAGPVSLDLKLVEADRVASPIGFFNSIAVVPDEDGNIPARPAEPIDGIVYDADDNPVEYHVLREHPGETFFPEAEQVDRIPAEQVIHTFRVDRPGQTRGVPEIAPALPLFSQLRRYTLAVIAAAEVAADITGVLESASDDEPEIDPVTGEEVDGSEPFDTVDVERRMLMTLPKGFKLNQLKAEQPTTTYAEFKKEVLNEALRCTLTPYNIGAGNSSSYNYASGRLDHQTYFRAIDVDRSDTEIVTLDRIFEAFMNEAILRDGLIPVNMRNPEAWEHAWFWDGWEHIDPNKEASADDSRLKNRTLSYARYYASKGLDWKDELRQIARETKFAAEEGLPPLAPAPAGGFEEDDDEG